MWVKLKTLCRLVPLATLVVYLPLKFGWYSNIIPPTIHVSVSQMDSINQYQCLVCKEVYVVNWSDKCL